MNKKQSITILFSSAGRRVELMRCFRRDAAELGINLRILATDMKPELSSACCEADKSFKVPSCLEAGFIEKLQSICEKESVSLIIPTIDTELPIMAEYRDYFSSRGTSLIISSPEVVEIAASKQFTAAFMQKLGITVPKTAAFEDFNPDDADWQWPLILKPDYGSASQGITILYKDMEWSPQLFEGRGYTVQEYWEGREYTVNLVIGRNGEVCAVVPHERLETRAGEVSKGKTIRHQGLIEAGHLIGHRLAGIGGFGPFCFQAIERDDGAFAVFEINARFGGGYPLCHAAGGRFGLWLLQDMIFGKHTCDENWTDSLLMLRYDSAFFSKK